jgi:hypothetical protein
MARPVSTSLTWLVVCRLLGQGESFSRVAFAVEGDHGLAEQREAFRSRIAHLTRGVNGLVEVQPGRCMVAPLGSVPDELAHQDGRFGLHAVKLPSDPGAHDVSGEETHLPEALAGVGKERRGRDMYVLLIEVLYLVAQVGDGHEISAAGVRERVVHPLRGFGQVASGQQVIELVKRDLEYAGEPRTYPGLGQSQLR